MKLYLFDTIERFNRLSRSLDAKTYLCNKTWNVFNDGGEKESYKFKEDGSMIIVLSGRISRGNWEYDPNDNTIEIYSANEAYMVHPSLLQDILVLNIDGTRDCAFLVDENDSEKYPFSTYSGLIEYFEKEERKRIEEEKEAERLRLEEEENRKRIEAEEAQKREIEQKKYKLRYTYEKKFKDILLINKYKCKSYTIINYFIIAILCILTVIFSFFLFWLGAKIIPEELIKNTFVSALVFVFYGIIIFLLGGLIEIIKEYIEIDNRVRNGFEDILTNFQETLPVELKEDGEFNKSLHNLGTTFNYKEYRKEINRH